MAPSTAVLWLSSQLLNEDTGIHFPDMTSGSVIGITVAICGNILISLALNFQKLAHNRLDREKSRKAREQELKTRKSSAVPSDNGDDDSDDTEGTSRPPVPSQGPQSAGISPLESSPLLRHFHSDPLSNNYGTADSLGDSSVGLISRSDTNPLPLAPATTDRNKFLSRLNPFMQRSKKQGTSSLMGVHEDPEPSDITHVLVPVVEVVDALAAVKNGKNLKNDDDLPPEHENESDYLKSKLWCASHLY